VIDCVYQYIISIGRTLLNMYIYFLLNTVGFLILHLQLHEIKLQIENFLVLLQVTLNCSLCSFFIVSVALVLIRVNSISLINFSGILY
jgi:hypothetical protein